MRRSRRVRLRRSTPTSAFVVRILVTLAISLASTCSAGAAEGDAFLSWLNREETLLARAMQASAHSGGVSVGPLAAAESLARRPGKGLDPGDTAWLAEDCERILAAQPVKRTALFGLLTKRLAAYRTAIQADPPRGVERGRALLTLRRILAGREFAWGPAAPSWLDRLWRQIADWLVHALSFLFSSGILYWILIGVGVLAAAGIMALIFGALRRRPPAISDGRPEEEKDRSRGRKAQSQDLSRQAEEAYDLGRYREALRLLYVALLQELDRAGAIRLLKHKTNWDYRREIEQKSEDLGRVFSPFTELYEAKWYGRELCAAEHYLEARRMYDAAREVAR